MVSPLNVLLVSQFLSGGGLERMVQLLGRGVAEQTGARVLLYTFDGADDPALRERLASQGVTVIHAPKGPGLSIKTARELARVIRRHRINIVHTHESAPLMYAVMAKAFCGLRRFGIVHTQHSFIHLDTNPKIARYDRWFSRLASHVTAVSPQVVETYARLGVPRERVRFVPNGVEIAKGPLPTVEQKRALRARLLPGKNENGATWLLALARLNPRKGQDHLINVWSALSPETRSRCQLIFVGPETSPGEKARLEQMAAASPDSGRIIFAGPSSEPLEWFKAADLYLSGSEYEGMPLAPIEAAGAGLSLVLSEIEGHEILRPFARLFKFDDSNAGANALEAALGDTGARHEQAAKIREKYGMDAMVRAYLELYKSA